ncbi:MAG: hypothetical protein K5856_03960 [Bacteroidaceae bacterium]|nr:hypothetical protein [Bacteroidaceae bacterium]
MTKTELLKKYSEAQKNIDSLKEANKVLHGIIDNYETMIKLYNEELIKTSKQFDSVNKELQKYREIELQHALSKLDQYKYSLN